MILTKEEIKRKIKKGKLKINPYNPKNLGPASYDLTLSNEFRMFKEERKISLSEGTDYRKYTVKKKLKSITLQPGEFVLAITKEKITLPGDVSGFLSGRTRFARMGIVVHATAFFVQPGVSNRQVLEIKNISNQVIVLKQGLKILQIIFVRNEGKARYKGKFRIQ